MSLKSSTRWSLPNKAEGVFEKNKEISKKEAIELNLWTSNETTLIAFFSISRLNPHAQLEDLSAVRPFVTLIELLDRALSG